MHARTHTGLRRHKCGGSAPAARQYDVHPSLQPTRPDVKPLGLQRGSSLCGRSCCLKVIESHQQALQRTAKGASSRPRGVARLYARACGREDHEEISRTPVGSSCCGHSSCLKVIEAPTRNAAQSQACPLLLATHRNESTRPARRQSRRTRARVSLTAGMGATNQTTLQQTDRIQNTDTNANLQPFK